MTKNLANIHFIYLYGSVVYGTDRPSSDVDLIVIVDRKDDVTITARAIAHAKGSFPQKQLYDVSIYTLDEFFTALHGMEISFLECVSLDRNRIYGSDTYVVKIDKKLLRESISKKASNSWVKAKKKLTVSEDYSAYIGKKSAWHSLRILMFGTQLAVYGTIIDPACANYLLPQILECETWEEIDTKFRELHNHLATEFRKVAPK